MCKTCIWLLQADLRFNCAKLFGTFLHCAKLILTWGLAILGMSGQTLGFVRFGVKSVEKLTNVAPAGRVSLA